MVKYHVPLQDKESADETGINICSSELAEVGYRMSCSNNSHTNHIRIISKETDKGYRSKALFLSLSLNAEQHCSQVTDRPVVLSHTQNIKLQTLQKKQKTHTFSSNSNT